MFPEQVLRGFFSGESRGAIVFNKSIQFKVFLTQRDFLKLTHVLNFRGVCNKLLPGLPLCSPAQCTIFPFCFLEGKGAILVSQDISIHGGTPEFLHLIGEPGVMLVTEPPLG